jgi:hypothetical protein
VNPPVLAFDIETIPDAAGIRRIHAMPAETPDAEAAEMAMLLRRQSTGSDFLPLHLQRVVAISVVLRDRDGLRAWSLGSPQDPERELIRRFFDGIDKYTPQLVSWNGGGFDLPVLQLRGLVHGVPAPRYWDLGEDERDFKWNNYLSRYHTRHLDLMDLLSLYQPRAAAPLDAMAQLCGFPGKLGMDGSQVWAAFQQGRIEAIRSYCETDAVNTYLLFLRFQKLRGQLDENGYGREIALVRETLGASSGAHWAEFLAAWDEVKEGGGG